MHWHRYVFHWTNGTTWGERIHFLLHGVITIIQNKDARDAAARGVPLSAHLLRSLHARDGSGRLGSLASLASFVWYYFTMARTITCTTRPKGLVGESFFASHVTHPSR